MTDSRPLINTLVLLGALVLHGVVASSVGLSVDEAHYALYALHLDLSYFDHPPLVGWIQWPLVALNAPDAVLRLIPQALWLLTAWLVHGCAVALARDLGEAHLAQRAGTWGLLAFALAPILHVLGIGLLPDTLLMLLSVALLRLVLALRAAPLPWPPGAWLQVGVLLGLAGLSKYTAIFLALALGLALVWTRGGRVLAQRGGWLAIALALLLVTPVIVWNAQHHWASFAYQAGHGAGGRWEWLHVARFVVLQALAYGPLLLWGLVPPAGTRPWWLFFALPFAVLALLAGGGTSLPHWTAPAWACLAPLAGVALARRSGTVGRRTRAALAAVQGVCSVALLALLVSGGVPLLTQQSGRGDLKNPSNPFADVHGWNAAGARARELAQAHGYPSVAVQNWTLASRLGWYARPLPVHVLEDRFDQFDWWAGDLPEGGSTLLVDWSQLAYEVPLGAGGFARCTPLGEQPVLRWGQVLSQFRFWGCTGWQGPPAPRLRGDSR